MLQSGERKPREHSLALEDFMKATIKLPLEYQDCILAIAKGMAYVKRPLKRRRDDAELISKLQNQ